VGPVPAFDHITAQLVLSMPIAGMNYGVSDILLPLQRFRSFLHPEIQPETSKRAEMDHAPIPAILCSNRKTQVREA
jgi:hypothetical protein